MEPCVITTCILLVIVFLWCKYYWFPHRRAWSLAAKIPGPRGYPIVGSIFMFMCKVNQTLPLLMRLLEEYGSTVRLWYGPRSCIIVQNPDDLQVVLGNPRVRNRDRIVSKAMVIFFGDGLLSNRDEKWKTHRKLISPAFNNKNLKAFIQVFGRHVKILMEKLEELDGSSFDVHRLLEILTSDTICEAAVGAPGNTQNVQHSNFAELVNEISQCSFKRFTQPWLMIDFIYERSLEGRKAKKIIKKTSDFTASVVTQRIAEYRQGQHTTEVNIKKVSSFLDIMVEASESRALGLGSLADTQASGSGSLADTRASGSGSLADTQASGSGILGETQASGSGILGETQASGSGSLGETLAPILAPHEIQSELTTLIVAGMETVTTAMSFFHILVALHPKVQAELHDELDQVFGSDDRVATQDDIRRLPVMDRCIKETLRLYPSGALLSREIDKDTPLPSGYTLPGGCTMMVLTYALHRDPRFYTRPLEFRPDRWLSESTHPYAYLPFGAGPRICPGQTYAMLQMKSVFSQILRTYRVTTQLTKEELGMLELTAVIGMDRSLENRYHIQLFRR